MYVLLLFLHVLGATIWAGGHLILTLRVLPAALRHHEPERVTAFESQFEPLGLAALGVQVLTGIWLAHRFLPPGQWLAFDNPVGVHIGLKFLFLALTIALAAHARLRLIPRLTVDRLPGLALHIVLVTILAVGFVLLGVGVRTGGLF